MVKICIQYLTQGWMCKYHIVFSPKYRRKIIYNQYRTSTQAKSFGIDTRNDRMAVIFASTLLTSLVVSISGIIGWVGIVIPHLARMIIGPDFRRLMPACISLGICYLILIDDLCRTLTSLEIPIGVITGIIGIPIFVYFIYTKKVNW